MLTVLAPGHALIQDLGRPGYAALGVPPSGALDAPALRLGNRLLGNPEGAPGIEAPLGGLRLRAETALTVVVTGAAVPGYGVPQYLRAGAVFELAAPSAGMRCYLTVRGGIELARELGSAATDTLSKLGPAPLRQGDVLRLGTPHGLPGGADVLAPARFPVSLTVPVHPGPRADWFADALTGGTWTVSASSDRIGTRLEGPALRRTPAFEGVELPSEPIRTGAVQVPTEGVPLIFLNDHPTTGGYPVPAVVAPGWLPRIAQARPGTTIRFTTAGSPR